MSEGQQLSWRRLQPGNAEPGGDTATANSRPAYSSQNNRFNNRGGRGYRGDADGRGHRGGWGGRGRGNRGGYQNNFFQKRAPEPQVDEADLYHLRDIDHHFWGDKISEDQDGKRSTFHDSSDRETELSYMLLFVNSNPRWTNDHIVFAKSKLGLLPEYAAKKEEHGEWDTSHYSKFAEEPEAEGAGTPGDDAVPTTNKNASNGNGAQTPSKDEHSASTKEPPTQAPEAGDAPKLETGDLPTTAENQTKASVKETPTAPEVKPAPTFVPSGRMKYTDVRLLPPEEQYSKPEPEPEPEPEPVYPAIPPIDYIPSQHHPIAVFEERRVPGIRGGGGRNRNARFTFAGWFKVSRINILSPFSAELVRMQQQKWERRDRFGNVIPTRTRGSSQWRASLGMEWAVVKFEKLEGEGVPEPPVIEKLPEPTREEQDIKGVDDRLSEMRMGGETKEENHAAVGNKTIETSGEEAKPIESDGPQAEVRAS
ncbi:hypothetical protein F5Y15DRAFT_163757 [Xylariaceae sp. FL0016]|nr:hypothetical protein F5Y15DRAFT_163757 [Xylariaceae sp. FL0016]